MTDSALQQLKRTWQASGSVTDEAAFLRERVRVGDLTQERLGLAAYCGHEGARKALGSRAREPLVIPNTVIEFVDEIGPAPLVLRVRTAIAAAALALPAWRSAFPNDVRVQRALEAAWAWVKRPGEAERAAAGVAADNALEAFHAAHKQRPRAAWAAQAASDAARSVTVPQGVEGALMAAECVLTDSDSADEGFPALVVEATALAALSEG